MRRFVGFVLGILVVVAVLVYVYNSNGWFHGKIDGIDLKGFNLSPELGGGGAKAAQNDATPTVQPQPAAQSAAQSSVQVTVVPTPTIPAAALTVDSENLPCALDNFSDEEKHGVQIYVDHRTDVQWEFDPNAPQLLGEDGNSTSGAQYAGCNFLVEGRKELTQEHHIWILRARMSQIPQYLGVDGIFRGREFSVWAYPTGWNMENFSTMKPPIAAEFVDAKRNNMLANGYDWPIFVHGTDGSVWRFDPGMKVGVKLPDNCDFSAPERIEVTGIYIPEFKSFDASVGAEGCWTVAWIDGEPVTRWLGAKDNVQFLSIEAWLMPSDWTQEQIDNWAKAHH